MSSVQNDRTCPYCLEEMNFAFARNICRHRFHIHCIAKAAIISDDGKAFCPCCRTEYPDLYAYCFLQRVKGNVATPVDQVNELRVIMDTRKYSFPDIMMNKKTEKKYLKAQKDSLKGLRFSIAEAKKAQFTLMKRLYKYVSKSSKNTFIINNMDKLCRCDLYHHYSKQTMRLMEKGLRMSRIERMKLAKENAGKKKTSKMSLGKFAKKDLCCLCHKILLPNIFVDFYKYEVKTPTLYCPVNFTYLRH